MVNTNEVNSMNAIPIVSIGLPVLNGEKYLERALISLINQSFKNFELIISDNCSTDRTSSICMEFCRRDPRIKYIRQNLNIGAVNNFLYVLRAAKSKYFMWAAFDDVWEPNFILFLKNALDAHSECLIAMSSFIREYEDGAVLDKIIFNEVYSRPCKRVFHELMMGEPLHIFMYGLYKREALEKFLFHRGFPEFPAHDRIFMCEFSLSHDFCFYHETLFKKVLSRTPLSVRYKNESIGKMKNSPIHRFCYAFYLLYWLLSSQNIPFHRKVYIIPVWIKLIYKIIKIYCLKRPFFQLVRFLKINILLKKFIIVTHRVRNDNITKEYII